MWVWLHLLLKHWSTLQLAWCLTILLFVAQAQCAHCGDLLSWLSTKFGSVSHCCDQLTTRTERRLFTVQEHHQSHRSGGLLTFQRCHCRSFLSSWWFRQSTIVSLCLRHLSWKGKKCLSDRKSFFDYRIFPTYELCFTVTSNALFYSVECIYPLWVVPGLYPIQRLIPSMIGDE